MKKYELRKLQQDSTGQLKKTGNQFQCFLEMYNLDLLKKFQFLDEPVPKDWTQPKTM